MSTSILPQKTINAIKGQIRFLRDAFGDCLNLWPKTAQEEYWTLARKRQEMENK